MTDKGGISFFNNKFYAGVHDDSVHGFDYTVDQYTPIAKLNPDRELGDGRIEAIDYETYRSAERAYRSGNIDSTSLGNITVIQLLEEVIRRQWRDFHAINAVKKIPVPKLQLDVPIVTKYAASKQVPELVAPDQRSNQFTQAQLRLFKNMVDVYESDESRLKANIEPLSFEIDQAAGALAEAANEQIVTMIEGATDGSNGANWATIDGTHGRNSNNPLSGLTSDMVTLTGNHFRPNILCMHPTDASNYLTNTFIQGQEAALDRNGVGTWALPKFPGLTAVVDIGFTAGTATMLDQNIALYGEGPTVAEQYRDPHRGADGWVIRQWIHPLLATSDGARRETSLQ